ncbi:MAG: ImmA/IrrE family metallo-endopeptidase [Acidaminococcaceae bacterium]
MMTKSEKGFWTANALRKDIGIDELQEIDLNCIVRLLNINVKHIFLGDGIDGACKSLGLKRLVVLNPYLKKCPKRERFTLAHEIGHLLMHYDSYICKQDCFYIYKTQNDKELEANDFAGQLLLPKQAVVNILEKNDLTFQLIKQIAEKYNISLLVAAISLTKLFRFDAIFLVHDGKKVFWKVRSKDCYLEIPGFVDEQVLARKTNAKNTQIKGNVNPQFWINDEDECLGCEEESVYSPTWGRYMTLLKFYDA